MGTCFAGAIFNIFFSQKLNTQVGIFVFYFKKCSHQKRPSQVGK